MTVRAIQWYGPRYLYGKIGSLVVSDCSDISTEKDIKSNGFELLAGERIPEYLSNDGLRAWFIKMTYGASILSENMIVSVTYL